MDLKRTTIAMLFLAILATLLIVGTGCVAKEELPFGEVPAEDGVSEEVPPAEELAAEEPAAEGEELAEGSAAEAETPAGEVPEAEPVAEQGNESLA